MRIHGHYYEPEFQTWKNMLARVFNPRWGEHYAHVKVWGDWAASYRVFLADVGRRPTAAHSLDRIDPNGSYRPDNVRWATKTTQSRNTRNHKTSKTGIRGVTWSVSKNKWRAAIYVNNRQRHVGYFDDLEAAAKARKLAEAQHWNT